MFYFFNQLNNLYKKNSKLVEKIVEGGIYFTATLSVVFIFLMFLFIFKEASPIVFSFNKAKLDSLNIKPSDSHNEELLVDEYNPIGDNLNSDSNKLSVKNNSTQQGDIIEYNPEVELINKQKDINNSINKSDVKKTDEDIISYNPEVSDSLIIKSIQPEVNINPDSAARAIIGYDYPILTHSSQVKLSHLFYRNWQPNSEFPRYGIYPIILGTLKTTFIAILLAAPIGIFAAIYTAFFAGVRIKEWLKPIMEILAAFPSVVIGFFCLMTIATFVQSVFGTEIRLNSIVGGIGLALVSIPIIYTITDDALTSVPKSLREAALALGATEWQTVYKIMVPAATPGIIAAVLLGFGRAMGETMIALMATGNAGDVSLNFFESVRTISATIGAEMGEVVFGSPHYQVLFFLGVLLFIVSFVINFITEFYVKQKLLKNSKEFSN